MKIKINWAKALGYLIKYAPLILQMVADNLAQKQQKSPNEQAFLNKLGQ